MGSNVAVLGASNNPERYSYKAVKMLAEKAYEVFPVHPSGNAVDGVECYKNLADIDKPLDTITIYLSAKNSTAMIDEIINSSPRRVIINPGAENEILKASCEAANIQVVEACTLVLLTTGQF